MMLKLIIASCCLLFTSLSAADFTVSSYNCGGLSEHYDYIRAAAMQKLMQERYNAEPALMAKAEKIQQLAVKILFGKDPSEQSKAQDEWDRRGYQQFLAKITASPLQENSPNAMWFHRCEELLSNYRIRPVEIRDNEVRKMLLDHFVDLTRGYGLNVDTSDMNRLLSESRRIMAERIFRHHLKYDIICLQEADYLTADVFPENYKVELSQDKESINGIAWNTNRFRLLNVIGNIMQRGFVVLLQELESKRTVLVASGHISGCNPYTVVVSPDTGISDSAKGDNELRSICEVLDNQEADIKIIGMDSNVTPMHPRLKLIKESGYQIDGDNFVDPTCTSPHQILNTRIDWIAVKSNKEIDASVTNIPVFGVGLNSIQTNISDHKPIASRIQYYP